MMGTCLGSPQVISSEKIQVSSKKELDYVEKTLMTIYETAEEDTYDGLHIKLGDEYEKLRSEWATLCVNLKSQ
ncbi:uncharacterized protein METZ01_LOCUS65342 [marine metagenome]|uniref:Uncharacterized protein n=1 Tax=marine metagenome TaxID=408172 RepID=A0A381TA89_9ZZZZ